MNEYRDLSNFVGSFAAVLREHRKRQGLSQERLAHEAGLYRTHIGLIERGGRQCTVITARKTISSRQQCRNVFAWRQRTLTYTASELVQVSVSA